MVYFEEYRALICSRLFITYEKIGEGIAKGFGITYEIICCTNHAHTREASATWTTFIYFVKNRKVGEGQIFQTLYH